MRKIHVGFLFSYDYEKLKHSLPPVYEHADRIFIAIDKDLRTWSGKHFTVDNTFFDWLKSIDKDNKIEIYEDDFYDSTLNAIENDNRERHMLSLKMGVGNWLVQVDSDEYFLDFGSFVKDLRKHDHFLDSPEKNKIQISVFLINIYKYVDGGILYVKEPTRCLVATNFPNYRVARNTRQRIIYTKHILLHETVARTEEEIKFKLENWGHNHQLNPDFLSKWKTVNKENYKNYRDFFYIEPEKWKELEFVKGENLKEIRDNINFEQIMPSDFYVWKKNFGQWFKFLFK
ncbi:hypothetical protein [Moheibacter sediminis]|uniref:Glycosyl transferase family 2 n=1 Tax=Moheibacter sediminis TaxID=1434700 RepID=A0A1W1ZND7_9FLAO|nr:hypothetical protein [Moheibacter sediminis]SMC49906.1 hypothetical protein SAMN06296427_103110 [Moheibacter sediminis]